MVGLNYLDFDFLGRKDSQLAVLFGGVLALVNVQRPKLIGEHIDGSLDLFAIGVASNDKVYDGSGERKGERLQTLPFSPGLNLGYQFTDFQKLTASYQFRYDHFAARRRHGSGLRTCRQSTATNGLGLAYEWRRAGYSLTTYGLCVSPRLLVALGDGRTDYDPEDQDYQKYARQPVQGLLLPAVHKIHLNAAYFGGRRLDRFSMLPVRPLRREPHPRRALVGRALLRAGHGARPVLVQPARPVPARRLPRPGARPRPRAGQGLAEHHRARPRLQPPRAVAHDGARRVRQELPAGAVLRLRLLQGSDHVPEAAMSNSPLKPHPTLTQHYRSDEERQADVDGLFDASAPHYDWICRVMSLGTGPRYRGTPCCGRDSDRDSGSSTWPPAPASWPAPPCDPRRPDRRDRPRPRAACSRSAGASSRSAWSRAEGEALPFRDEHFDMLSMGYALRHVPDLRLAFAEYHRVLRFGGSCSSSRSPGLAPRRA